MQILLLVAVLVASHEANAMIQHDVHVQVVELGTGRPIPAATVDIKDQKSSLASGPTDAEGAFLAKGIRPEGDGLVVECRKVGFKRSPETVRTTIAQATKAPVEVLLVRSDGDNSHYQRVGVAIVARAEAARPDDAVSVYRSLWSRILELDESHRATVKEQLDAATEKRLARAVQVTEAGDFEAAIVELSELVERFEVWGGRKKELSRANLYLAVNYLALAQERSADSYFVESLRRDIDTPTALKGTLDVARLYDVAAEKPEVQALLQAQFKEVPFPEDGATIESGNADLDRVARLLKALPARVTLEGHSDPAEAGGGQVEASLALGERRARSVLDYLVASGVPRKQLKTVSYGKEAPLCHESTSSCRATNRRVRLTVTPSTVLRERMPEG